MSPEGGRKRLTRGVFSIEDQQLTLPDPITLDTSFVVEALLATQPTPQRVRRLPQTHLRQRCLGRHQRAASHRARRDGFRDRHERTLGPALASSPDRRTLPPACRKAAAQHHLALRRAPHPSRSLPGTARRHHDRRHHTHGRVRHRILRRSPRGNCHLRRRRDNRHARHRLRAPAFHPTHDVHGPLATHILSRQATTLPPAA
jgi:hypothetical protein